MNVLCIVLVLALALVSVNAFVPTLGRAMSSRLQMADIELIFPNKKKVKAAPGTPLKDACKKAGFVPSYGCSEGKCGSCEMVMSNGKKIRPCTAKIPALPSPITFTV